MTEKVTSTKNIKPYWTEGPMTEGPINLTPSVRLSVRMSLCPSVRL